MNTKDLPLSQRLPVEHSKESPLPSGMAHSPLRPHVAIDGDKVRNGLAQLVLTLVKLLHELLERQAIRRMDSGTLTDEEIEKLGQTLMRQAEELERLREVFDLKDEDLNLDLGPLGRLF